MASPDSASMAARARALMRGLDRASLACALPDPHHADAPAWPYASLVMVAHDHDLSPILLLSDLAAHSRAIAADDRIALLYDGTQGLDTPLAGPRVSVLGRARRLEKPGGPGRDRYLRRHPDSILFEGFGDFCYYRMVIERVHLIGGFGHIRWLSSEDIDLNSRESAALAESEADIVTHMNQDHASTIDLYANRLLHLPEAGWRMTGIDQEGIDLRRGGRVGRLSFDKPVRTPGAARRALSDFARKAREVGHE